MSDHDPVTLPKAALDAMLEAAAERGAKKALHSVGLGDEEAAEQIRGLRDLFDMYRAVRFGTGTESRLRLSTGNSTSYIDASFDFSTKHVIGGRWEDATQYLYANGALQSSGAAAFNNAGGRFSLSSGPGSGASGFVSMAVARVLGVKGITDAERDLIHGKLAYLGGIQSLLPDGHPYKRATFV